MRMTSKDVTFVSAASSNVLQSDAGLLRALSRVTGFSDFNSAVNRRRSPVLGSVRVACVIVWRSVFVSILKKTVRPQRKLCRLVAGKS